MTDPGSAVTGQIRRWRDDLIDLTRRNKLLSATSGRSKPIRIVEPDIGPILDRLADVERQPAATSWKFYYPPLDSSDSTDLLTLAALESEGSSHSAERQEDELLTDISNAVILSKRLRSLERRATSEFMDRGLRVLYLGLGLMRWSAGEDDWFESPIIMRPVHLLRASPRDPFQLFATDDDVVVNPALSVKLESDFNIILPDFDVTGEVDETLANVKRAVDSQPGWQVKREVLFGHFSFYKEAMYRDLKENEGNIVASSLVGAVAGLPDRIRDTAFEPIPEDVLDERGSPEEMASILDADSTQRQCLLAGRDGKTFVMDGPPGTGKSQTIANLIAELLAANKTILFVSEKAAALEVVKSRLDGSHLGSFVLELHSNKATRKEVAKALGTSIGERPRPTSLLSANDLAKARERRRSLSKYATAQNEIRKPLGRSLHWAIGRRAQLEEIPAAPPPESVTENFTDADFASMLELAEQASSAWAPIIRGRAFLWRDVRDPNELLSRRSQTSTHLDETRRALEHLDTLASAMAGELGLQPPKTSSEVGEFLDTLQLLRLRKPVPESWLMQVDSAPRDERRLELEDQHQRWVSAVTTLGSRSLGWKELHPATIERLRGLQESFQNMSPPLEIGTMQIGELDRWTAFDNWLISEGTAVGEAGRQLQEALGLTNDPALMSLQTVASLACLGGQPHLPEVAWFDRDELGIAQRAIQVLRPLVESRRTLEAQLLSIYDPSVFELDIASFYRNPTDLVPQLSRFTSSGRRNRRELKACTRSASVTTDNVQGLSLVRLWHQQVYELANAEELEAAVLGSTYYTSTSTNFDALENALQTARIALDLLQTSRAPSELSSRLASSSSSAAQIAELGKQLSERLATWSETLVSAAGAIPTQLQDADPVEVASWAQELSTPLKDLIELGHSSTDKLGPLTTVDDLWCLCEARKLVQDVEDHFTVNASADSQLFGALYQGIDSDWLYMAAASQWAADVSSRLGPQLNDQNVAAVLTIDQPVDELEHQYRLTSKNTEAVIAWFEGEYRAEIERELCARADDATALVSDLSATIDDLHEWTSFCVARSGLQRLRLNSVFDYCAESEIRSEQVVDVFERAVLTSWIDSVLASDPRCTMIRADDRDHLVEAFQDLDREIIAHAAGRVMEVANERRPSSVIGDFATIRRESEKKTRHRPIKVLLKEAGGAAQALKPCFMMSPLSVSQFLPSSFRFDAVIFDEASQVRPGDAIGSIYRGDQLIVAGDNKQLPPSAFFDRALDSADDEYDPEAFDDFESLLDLCRGSVAIPELPLRWHYRSRHEDLITYSNQSFYGGSLVTFPGALAEGDDVGLSFIHVPDGIYRRGSSRDNPIEASRVVERILFHAEHHPNHSLGVVAFSDAQATRIQWELESRRRERPDLDNYFRPDRLNGFFIKNLETVQGDERDIIIFSIGYGRDEAGKFTMNFGPLNQAGGHRRLNVAITRARYRVEVLSSVRAEDFSPSPSVGVNHLRGYLDFAEHGLAALVAITDGDGEPESPFEEAVLSTILGWGFDVRSQVGQAGYRIDLAIRDPRHPGKWLLGVECDGAAYHSSRTARDRDRLRQKVLEGLGWHLYRIWGPSWYHNRAGAEERLRQAIDAALNGSPTNHDARTESVSVEIEQIEIEEARQPNWTTHYRPVRIERVPVGTSFDDYRNRSRLDSDVLSIVRGEGPVHVDIIVQRLRWPWRADGTRSRFRSAVEDAVHRLCVERRTEMVGRFFVADPGRTSTEVRVPTGDSSKRDIMCIPPDELRAALVLSINDGVTIGKKELFTRVARMFGWGRTGSNIEWRLEEQIRYLETESQIVTLPNGRLSTKDHAKGLAAEEDPSDG